MVMKSSIITTFVDRVAPLLKKGAKASDNPNVIRFKPSDLPELEELATHSNKETGEYIENIAQKLIEPDAEVAPFAERLIHPRLFGLDPAINKTRALVRTAERAISQMKNTELQEQFSTLYTRILNESTNIDNLSGGIAKLIEKVELLDNPVYIADIKAQLKYLNRGNKKEFKNHFGFSMRFIETLTDASNTLRGKYRNTWGETEKFYNWMQKRDIWMLDILEGTKKDELTYRKNLITNKRKHKKYANYKKQYDEYTQKGLAATFENNRKMDAIRYFFDTYSIRTCRKDTAKELYKEYLATLNPEVAKECKAVQDEFGTYIFTSNADTTAKDIQYVKEELRLWKEAGKEEMKMPEIIDVNFMNEFLIRRKAAGIAQKPGNKITVRELLQFDGVAESSGSTLRHEIQHIEDDIEFQRLPFKKRVKKKLKWWLAKLIWGKSWNKELENAGLKNKKHRKYGLTDRAELKSVTAETNMEDLSEKFKDQMERFFRMKKWIFNVGENKVAKESKMLSKATEQVA